MAHLSHIKVHYTILFNTKLFNFTKEYFPREWIFDERRQ